MRPAIPTLWLMNGLAFSRRLAHGDHPVLHWMAGNAAIETDADNGSPLKKKWREEFDEILAFWMTFDRAITRPPEPACWYRPWEPAV